jgi:hypothetical protein
MRKHQLGEVSTSPEKILRLVERLQMQVYAPYAVEKDVGSFQRCPNGTSYEALCKLYNFERSWAAMLTFRSEEAY